MMLLGLMLAAAVDVPFGVAARARLPVVVAELRVHGTVQRCTGTRLGDLAARAGLASGEALKGQALVTVIVAEAADGYRVAFTLGEIDARLGNAEVLVADHCDGKVLAAADGPVRLVVPGEARGARSVRRLVRLTASVVP